MPIPRIISRLLLPLAVVSAGAALPSCSPAAGLEHSGGPYGEMYVGSAAGLSCSLYCGDVIRRSADGRRTVRHEKGLLLRDSRSDGPRAWRALIHAESVGQFAVCLKEAAELTGAPSRRNIRREWRTDGAVLTASHDLRRGRWEAGLSCEFGRRALTPADVAVLARYAAFAAENQPAFLRETDGRDDKDNKRN